MNKAALLLTAAVMGGAAMPSFAGDRDDAIAAGAIGAFTGAYIGQNYGGYEGGLLGAVIGAAAGVAIASHDDDHRHHGYYDGGGYGRPAHYDYDRAYYAPPPPVQHYRHYDRRARHVHHRHCGHHYKHHYGRCQKRCGHYD